jgi:hypothetical protein
MMDTLVDCAGTVLAAGTPIPAGGSPLRLYEFIQLDTGGQAFLINGAFVAGGFGLSLPSNLLLGSMLESYVSELIVFTAVVTVAQRQQIEAYMGLRYGIPLPMTHAYNNSGIRAGSDAGTATVLASPFAVFGLQSWLRPDSLPANVMLPLWPNSAPPTALSAYAEEVTGSVTVPSAAPSPSPNCLTNLRRAGG